MANKHRNAGKSKSKKSSAKSPHKSSTLAPTSPKASRGFSTTGTGTPSRTSAMEAKPTPLEITQQSIAEAAYYLWLRRGGDEISNWLEAEHQLRHGTFAR